MTQLASFTARPLPSVFLLQSKKYYNAIRSLRFPAFGAAFTVLTILFLFFG
jgi:hypothetical protein